MLKQAVLLVGAALALAAAVALLLGAGLPERASYTGQNSTGQIAAPEIGAFAPSFTLNTAHGRRVSLRDLHEGPVIINFWATWCAPCRIEMPELQTIYQRYQARGLRVLAINLGESAAEITAWAQHFGLTFDLLLDAQGETAALYHLRGQPSTYIVAPGGMISAIFYGPTSARDLQNALAGYFSD